MFFPTSDEIAQIVIEILMEDHGYTREEAVAIVGMLRDETTFEPMFSDLVRKQLKLMVN